MSGSGDTVVLNLGAGGNKLYAKKYASLDSQTNVDVEPTILFDDGRGSVVAVASDQTTGTLTYTSANNSVTYSGVSTLSGAIIQIISSSITGSPIVSFEGSPDSGTTWYAIYARPITTASQTGLSWTLTYSAANETKSFYIGNLQGLNQFRVRVSTTGTAGTGAVTINLAMLTVDVPPWTGPAGVSLPPFIAQVGGANGANLQPLQLDASNNLKVIINASGTATPVTQSGTWNISTVTTVTTLSQFPSTAALADATANPTLTEVQTFPMGFNGTTWDRLQVDASKFLKVSLAAAPATVTVTGTIIANAGTGTLATDPIDRAARLLGVISAGTNAIGRETGTESAGNTTSTVLGSNAVFTGTLEDVKDYASLTLTVFTDQASAANGLQFGWSSDGATVDVTSLVSVTASAGRAFNVTTRARYFQVKYTNGATAQGTFRLKTVYHPTGTGIITRPIGDTISTDNFAQIVRSATNGYDGVNFQNVGVLNPQADAVVNTTIGLVTSSFGYGFNGTTWDRLQVDASRFLKVNVAAGTVAATQSGVWTVQPGNTANTTAWLANSQAIGSTGSAVPAQGELVAGRAMVNTLPTAATSGNLTSLPTDSYGRLHVRTGIQSPQTATHFIFHEPAANAQATISQAAGAAGIRHVCTGITASIGATASAPAAIQLFVRLRDGATGAGTVIWSMTISLPAVAGAMNGVARSGLWIVGTAATAMTLEFSAAGGANTQETVSLEIVDIAE